MTINIHKTHNTSPTWKHYPHSLSSDKQRLLYPLLSLDIIPIYVIPLIATAETTATAEKTNCQTLSKYAIINS